MQAKLLVNWYKPSGKWYSSEIGDLVKDLKDCFGRIIAPKGTSIRVSPGKMKKKERKFYFENQSEILGKIVEFYYMSFGLKDKPRSANFKRVRSERDM